MAKALFVANSNGNFSNSDQKISIQRDAAVSLSQGKADGIGKHLNEYGWTVIKPVIEIEMDIFAKVKDF